MLSDESHPTGTCTNPYGRTKYFTEEIIKDVCFAYPVRQLASSLSHHMISDRKNEKKYYSYEVVYEFIVLLLWIFFWVHYCFCFRTSAACCCDTSTLSAPIPQASWVRIQEALRQISCPTFHR